MYKRILALVMSLVLLFTAIPFGASAQETEDARIRTQIRRVYRRALSAAGKTSFNGYCGLMTGYQLWALGVTPYPITLDGKDMYDYYKNRELSAGGYPVKPYPAREYSLEEALNLVTHCGTRNAYNIMVCFQKTSSEAGKRYGHAMVIHAILDGTVYFVEGYYTAIGGAEGNVLTCSIPEFAKFYGDWVYEGIVVFGQKKHTDFCDTYATDMFASAKGTTCLLSLPCEQGTEGCRAMRTTFPGELLHITDVYTANGQFFYRIDDGGVVAYIPVGAVELVRSVTESVELLDESLPQQLAPGQDFLLAGKVMSQNSLLEDLSVTVTDIKGNPMLGSTITTSGRMTKLSRMNSELNFGTLPQGVYILTVTVDVENTYVTGDGVQTRLEPVELCKTLLTVGQPQTEEVPVIAEPSKNGWVWENEKWYFYQNGAPRTGWFCYEGMDYYFLEDGAAATGWHEINGRWRCFTAHGAMRTGWVDTDQGRCYMLSNGAAAIGWRQIDGDLYFFSEAGLMATEGTGYYENSLYNIGPDGIAVRAG